MVVKQVVAKFVLYVFFLLSVQWLFEFFSFFFGRLHDY